MHGVGWFGAGGWWHAVHLMLQAMPCLASMQTFEILPEICCSGYLVCHSIPVYAAPTPPSSDSCSPQPNMHVCLHALHITPPCSYILTQSHHTVAALLTTPSARARQA